MLKKLKTILIVVLLGAVAYLLFQGSTFIDNRLENKPKQWVQKESIVAPVTKTSEEIVEQFDEVMKERDAVIAEAKAQALAYEADVDTSSPEIDNSDYGWIQTAIRTCHPAMKDEVKEAMANDDMLRQNEYNEIMGRCVAFNERASVSDKAELKRFLLE